MFFDELSNDEWALLSALVSDEPAVRLNRRGRPRADPRVVANAGFVDPHYRRALVEAARPLSVGAHLPAPFRGMATERHAARDGSASVQNRAHVRLRAAAGAARRRQNPQRLSRIQPACVTRVRAACRGKAPSRGGRPARAATRPTRCTRLRRRTRGHWRSADPIADIHASTGGFRPRRARRRAGSARRLRCTSRTCHPRVRRLRRLHRSLMRRARRCVPTCAR